MTAFPLLPLRDIVVFPGMVVPLFVGRDKSVAALEAAMEGEKDIFLLAQLDPSCDEPEKDDLFTIGVVAQVLVPVEYSGFLWAILFGWLFFAEGVSTATLAGAALIVLGCWLTAPRAPAEQSLL